MRLRNAPWSIVFDMSRQVHTMLNLVLFDLHWGILIPASDSPITVLDLALWHLTTALARRQWCREIRRRSKGLNVVNVLVMLILNSRVPLLIACSTNIEWNFFHWLRHSNIFNLSLVKPHLLLAWLTLARLLSFLKPHWVDQSTVFDIRVMFLNIGLWLTLALCRIMLWWIHSVLPCLDLFSSVINGALLSAWWLVHAQWLLVALLQLSWAQQAHRSSVLVIHLGLQQHEYQCGSVWR